MFEQQKQTAPPVFHNKGCYRSNFSQMKTGAVLQGLVSAVKLRPKKSKKLHPGSGVGEKKTFYWGGNGIEVN